MVQETHWGLGKTEGKWRIGTWTAIVSPDSKSRYAGVATFVSSRIAEESQISHSVCLPGRILHVRCEGARTRLDIVNCYQWVWQDKQAETVQKNRSHFWSKLGGLLHSLPVRNMLLLGADFNSKLRPVAGLVGRGLMKSSQGNETELEAILQTHNLVLANTWTSSRPSKAHTFRNGATMSQLDFLATRRLTVDAEAKKSAPVLLDLVPWRKGPKHRPVSGSFKWVAGWSCAKKKQKSQAYSKQDLREHLAANTDRAQVLRSFVQGAIAESRDRLCFTELNRVVLRKCVELFPAKQVASDKPRDMPQVQQAINSMWLAYEQLRAPLPTGQFQRASVAVSRQLHFQKASREMKQHSRQARKQWLLDKIVLAEQAAQKKDYAELYRIINKVAPKKRREQVRIRSRDGGLLTKQQEFAEIFDYFSKAFKSGSACIGTTPNCLVLSREEVTDALSQLKRGKAVPTASVPAEVWQTCPDEYADALSGMLSARANHGLAVPSEISHCELSLLPKPGKDSRRPCDLRPLGLQDPSSKVYALAVRARLMETIQPVLEGVPQYAYIPGKSIDQAIMRVARHCRDVRQRLREGASSVHQRRQGLKSGVCYGGVMISIDLSRAFDTLTRQALAAALDMAGVPLALWDAIVSLHNACKYAVKHHVHSAEFPMEMGVRQGCTLAPTLYSLFTALFWRQLAQCTTPEWADSCVTMFADDKHMFWSVESVADLNFVCRCIQQTFRLLQSFGMQVNSSKSKLVIALRGSAGKRWQRKHLVKTTTGPALEVGTPHSPLQIPVVHSMVYLGVVASYGSYELQTLQHRQQAAAQNRHRLLKFLHGKMLSLQERVRLYNACVRSALLYGLHVVGLTGASARTLDSSDMRSLRAIAKSPVHLSRESNTALRRRLHIDSAVEAVQKRIQRKTAGATATNDTDWYAGLQASLEEIMKYVDALEPVHLSRDLFPGVPCPECGLYLTNHRHMLSHRARKHGYRAERSVKSMGTSHVQHSVDGMPHCKHCHKTFTRVEGFKKHLKGACPVLFGSKASMHRESATAVAVQVAPQQEGLRMGSTDRAPQADSPGCLVDDAEFQVLSCKGWKTVLRDPRYKKNLGTYCVFCGQWCAPQGFKQHIRLMHKHLAVLHQPALDRCTSLGLPAQSPCCFCGVSHRQPRRHLACCSAVYQASLANLYLVQQFKHAQACSNDGGLCSGGQEGCGNGVWGGRGQGHAPAGEAHGAGGSLAGPLAQGRDRGANKVAKGAEGTVWRQRKLVFMDPEPQAQACGAGGGSRGRRGVGPGHQGAHRGHDADEPQARSGAGPAETRHRVYAVHRHSRLQLLSQASSGGGQVADTVCQPAGHHVVEGGPDVGPLPAAAPKGGRTAEGRGEPREAHEGGVAVGRTQCPGSGLPLLRVEPIREEGASLHSASHSTDGGPGHAGHSRAEHHGAGSVNAIQVHPTVERVPPLGGDAFSGIPEPSPRGSPSLPSMLRSPIRELGDEVAGSQTSAGEGATQQSSSGSGGRLSCYQLLQLGAKARLAEAAVHLADGNGGREAIDLGRSVAGMPRSACRTGGQNPSLPNRLLRNPHNICYANSSAQAFYWSSMLAVDAGSCAGSLRAGLSSLAASGSMYLPDSLTWRRVFVEWQGLAVQHDVSEFYNHLLQTAAPTAYMGRWESRLENPHTIVDSGDLYHPLLLHFPGASLSELIRGWKHPYAVQALCQHSTMVLLQLCRYGADGSNKNTFPVNVPPGSAVQLPVFADCTRTTLRMETFRVILVIFHIGDRVTSGHYQAALCYPTADDSWEYRICNDNRAPKKARPSDLKLLAHNAYLIGLQACAMRPTGDAHHS